MGSKGSKGSRHTHTAKATKKGTEHSPTSSVVGLQPNLDFTHSGFAENLELGNQAVINSKGMQFAEDEAHPGQIAVQKEWSRIDQAVAGYDRPQRTAEFSAGQ